MQFCLSAGKRLLFAVKREIGGFFWWEEWGEGCRPGEGRIIKVLTARGTDRSTLAGKYTSLVYMSSILKRSTSKTLAKTKCNWSICSLRRTIARYTQCCRKESGPCISYKVKVRRGTECSQRTKTFACWRKICC